MSTDFLAEHAREIDAAARRIAGEIRRTPTLLTDLGDDVVLKAENLQVTGSFKPRGATNAVLALRASAPEVTGVIGMSSGNHAQALARAGRRAGLDVVVVISQNANPRKIAATIALGAEVITEGVTDENRDEIMKRVGAERGLVVIPPFDHWDIIHGQGTAALEILDDYPDVSVIVTPVGGGGLISGTALAAKARSSDIVVVGVEPSLADDAAQAFARREPVCQAAGPTMADGTRTPQLGERPFEVIVERRLVDDIVTVTEDELADAVRAAWLTARVAVEPTGALALAAYLTGKLPRPPAGGRTALLMSGGNGDPQVYARIFAGA